MIPNQEGRRICHCLDHESSNAAVITAHSRRARELGTACYRSAIGFRRAPEVPADIPFPSIRAPLADSASRTKRFFPCRKENAANFGAEPSPLNPSMVSPSKPSAWTALR